MWWSDQSSACFVLRFHSFGFVASCKNLGPHSFTKSSLHLTAGLPCVRFGPRGCHSKSARVHRVPLRDATREAHFHLLSLQYRTTSVRRDQRRVPEKMCVLVTLKIVCEPQQLSLESVFKASSRYSEHIRNNQKPRKFHSEAVGSSEVLACTGPISRNPLVTRSVGILLSC